MYSVGVPDSSLNVPDAVEDQIEKQPPNTNLGRTVLKALGIIFGFIVAFFVVLVAFAYFVLEPDHWTFLNTPQLDSLKTQPESSERFRFSGLIHRFINTQLLELKPLGLAVLICFIVLVCAAIFAGILMTLPSQTANAD